MLKKDDVLRVVLQYDVAGENRDNDRGEHGEDKWGRKLGILFRRLSSMMVRRHEGNGYKVKTATSILGDHTQ